MAAYLELGIAHSLDFGSPHGGLEYTLSAMQKLFSMFPRGAPGLALMLMRLFFGAVLIVDASNASSAHSTILACVFIACALTILAGFITPVAAILAALAETAVLNAHVAQIALLEVAPIVVAVSLALLGPGAYSIDARLFGRRLMQFGPGLNDGREVDR